MASENQFSVVQFVDDGSHEYIRRSVSAQKAVETAKLHCSNVAARIGIIQRVIITDGGDYINFEWKFGEGITFPKSVASGLASGLD